MKMQRISSTRHQIKIAGTTINFQDRKSASTLSSAFLSDILILPDFQHV
uniref:Uncharacterized protein n=1 Tax=Arundo donax TaxID=35708 RepID=A0A0A9HDG0_ARUDO